MPSRAASSAKGGRRAKKLIEAFTIGDASSELMRMSALIRSNLGTAPSGMSEKEYAEAYCQAIWLEQFRLRNQAEMLAAIFGGKKGKG